MRLIAIGGCLGVSAVDSNWFIDSVKTRPFFFRVDVKKLRSLMAALMH